MSELGQDLHDAGVALDKAADTILGGPPKQTLSQSIGLYVLSGSWWAYPCSWFLSFLMNERHHAVRSLYGDDGKPIFPDRMPEGSPASNPYPTLEKVRPSLFALALFLCLASPALAQEHCANETDTVAAIKAQAPVDVSDEISGPRAAAMVAIIAAHVNTNQEITADTILVLTAEDFPADLAAFIEGRHE